MRSAFGVVVTLLFAACGPAPGYGPDGRLIRGPYYGPVYRNAQGRPNPGGYVSPSYGPAPAYAPPSGYSAPPSYPPSATAEAAPPATDPGVPEAYGTSSITADPNAYPVDDGSAYPAPNDAAPIAPDPNAPAAPDQGTCADSCRFAGNGECDDGRSGSDTDLCAAGTDCTDCGGTP